MTRLLYLIFIIYSIAAASATETGLVADWTTTTGSSVYLHHRITLNCRGVTVSTSRQFLLTIRFASDLKFGCSHTSFTGWIYYTQAPQGILPLTQMTDAFCRNLLNTHVFSIDVNVTTELSALSTLACCYKVGQAEDPTTCVAFHLPKKTKVAPSNLHMNITPTTVIEGQRFSVECKSTAADPESKYDYIITKLKTGEKVTAANTHVTTSDDRGGLKVRCVDYQHPDYDNKIETEAERVIIPAYIDYIGQERKGEQIDSDTGEGETILNCSKKIEGKPDLEYEWKRKGSDIQNTGPSYSVGNNGKKHNQREEYECTAKVVNFDLSATYKWQITWRDRKEDADSILWIIVGVLVGVAVCVSSSIGGYVWWKNQMKKQVRVGAVMKDAGRVRGKQMKEEVEPARVKAGAANPTTIESSGTTQQQIGPVRKEAGVAHRKQEKAKGEYFKGKKLSANQTTLESSVSTQQQIPLQKKSSRQRSPVKR